MSGVDDCLGGGGKDFFSDPIEKEVAIPSGQVPTADAIGKQNVAVKKLAAFREIKAKAARTMARNMKDPGFGPGSGKGAALIKQMRGLDGAQFLGQSEGKHGIRLEAEKRGFGMVVNVASGPVGQSGGIPDMVPVSVGQEKGIGLELFPLEKIEKAFRGVNGQKVATEIKEVSVGGSKAAGED